METQEKGEKDTTKILEKDKIHENAYKLGTQGSKYQVMNNFLGKSLL